MHTHTNVHSKTTIFNYRLLSYGTFMGKSKNPQSGRLNVSTPKISLFEIRKAWYVTVDGTHKPMVCPTAEAVQEFAATVEQQIVSSKKKIWLYEELSGLDYSKIHDRWFAIVVLNDHKCGFKVYPDLKTAQNSQENAEKVS
jgi:hypothetical protein